MFPIHQLWLFVFSCFLIIVAPLPTLLSQPKVPPIAVSPQSPSLGTLTPFGAQKGSTIELIVTGLNLAEPIGLWTSFPAKITPLPGSKSPQDATKQKFKLEIGKEATVGFHSLRIATRNGISNARIFCIDELPEVVETDTNHTKSTAQPVQVPSVISGRCDPERSDFFKISVKEGQRLTFEVLGHRLGSLFDPIIMLYDAQGVELPGLYSDDAPGLQTDARLTYTFKRSGEYLLEIHDSTYRGGADFFYRLRIGDFPAAITPFPVALKRGSQATIAFAGPVVENTEPVTVTMPADPAQLSLPIVARYKGGVAGWPVSLLASDRLESTEMEPNNDIEHANRVTIPSGVSGRFLEKNDVDYYVFAAKKGTKYIITADTYEIGSPAEVYLILRNAKKADLAKSNPNTATRIEYTPQEDGDLFIHAEQLNYAHGTNEIYHLNIKTDLPELTFDIGLDRCEARPGGSTFIPILNMVRRAYNGAIEVSIVGHPGVSGSVIIPANNPAPAAGQVLAYLPVVLGKDLPQGPIALKVKATALDKKTALVCYGSTLNIVRSNLAGLAFPPRDMLNTIFLDVTEKPIFALSAALKNPELVRGTPGTVVVSAERSMSFNDEISLILVGLPANVAATIKPIGKGAKEMQIQLTAAANATPGTYTFAIRGLTKTGGKEFAYFSPPVTLVITNPFEVKMVTTELRLQPGTHSKFKVMVVRKGSFNGVIDLEMKNLPANVTSPKVQVPSGKNEAEFDVSAAPTAQPIEKADIIITGVSGPNNIATSPFKVRVEKAAKK